MNMNTHPFDSSFKVARHISTNVISAIATHFDNFIVILYVDAIINFDDSNTCISRNVAKETMYTLAPVVQSVVYTDMSDFIDNYKYRF